MSSPELLERTHAAMVLEVKAYGARTEQELAREILQQVSGVSDLQQARDLVASALLTNNDWTAENVDHDDYWTFDEIN